MIAQLQSYHESDQQFYIDTIAKSLTKTFVYLEILIYPNLLAIFLSFIVKRSYKSSIILFCQRYGISPRFVKPINYFCTHI